MAIKGGFKCEPRSIYLSELEFLVDCATFSVN